MSDRQLFTQVAWHFAMGAALGAIFITVLLILNVQHLFDTVMNSSSPVTCLIALGLGVSAQFAFGAAITGFHLIIECTPRSDG